MMSDARNRNNKLQFNRNFMILFWADNAEHMKALDILKSYSSVAYILHDKDTHSKDIYIDDEDMDFKKPHYHAVVQFKNSRFWDNVADELGIEERFVRGCNLNGALAYLVHFDHEDKYQYDISEVFGSLCVSLKKIINSRDKDENEKVCDLISYITTSSITLSVTNFATYCASNGYWDVYRRAGAIFNMMLGEHNDYINYKERLKNEN